MLAVHTPCARDAVGPRRATRGYPIQNEQRPGAAPGRWVLAFRRGYARDFLGFGFEVEGFDDEGFGLEGLAAMM